MQNLKEYNGNGKNKNHTRKDTDVIWTETTAQKF